MMDQDQTSSPLVSIITPVYNGAPFLERFMTTILNQTYPRIELILVDDGSFDDTYKRAIAYAPEFARKGFFFNCIQQEHTGAAAAVNKGLLSFSGNYLKWMDCDDLLEPNCIEEELDFLLAHPECGFVICDSLYVKDGTLDPIRTFGRIAEGEDKYFWDILRGTHNYSLGAGTILVSRDKLQSALRGEPIFESPEGQNYQLMLPLTYRYRCAYLHRPLFWRVVRNDSHSHKERSYLEQKARCYNFITLLKATITSMQIPEKLEAFALIETRFAHMLLPLAFTNGDLTEVRRCGQILHREKALGHREAIQWIAAKHTFLYGLLKNGVKTSNDDTAG